MELCVDEEPSSGPMADLPHRCVGHQASVNGEIYEFLQVQEIL